MSLRDKQVEFARALPRLIDRAFELGYQVTLGDAYRDPRNDVNDEPPYGSKSSKHRRRLAIDLNLFTPDRDGNYQYCTDTEQHEELGHFWQLLGGRWGGDWNDGNHYEWPL